MKIYKDAITVKGLGGTSPNSEIFSFLVMQKIQILQDKGYQVEVQHSSECTLVLGYVERCN